LKRTTIHDIARELNITFSTVARALNDHPAISAATKKAVKETAERLNYKQNKIASSLRSGHTHIVGIIVPSLHVSFFSSVVAGIEPVMNKNGYAILLYQSNESFEQEKKGIETLLQLRVDGIISSITTETFDTKYYEEVQNRNVPLVFFDRALDIKDVPSVTINDYKGGFLAAEHLIKQGYKRIVHITAEEHIGIFEERMRGYLDALAFYKIPIDERLIIKGKFSLEFGRECVRHLLKENIAFDSIFALEDFTALGAIEELKKKGIRIPEDVGIIGFANEAFGEHVTPSLSTVDQHPVKMGEEAAKMLLRMLKNDEDAPIEKVKKIILEPALMIKESSNRVEYKTPRD